MITRRDADILYEFGSALCWVAAAMNESQSAYDAITRARQHLQDMVIIAEEERRKGTRYCCPNCGYREWQQVKHDETCAECGAVCERDV